MTRGQRRGKTGQGRSVGHEAPVRKDGSTYDSAYYDGIAEGYDELHGAEQEQKYRLILSHLTFEPGDRILDVGCGTGLFLSFVHTALGHDPALCQGIDPSAKLLARVPLQFSKNVQEASAENLPFKDGTFDAVVSVTCLQNMRDPTAAVNEMKRVGKGGDGNGKKACAFAISFLKKSPRRDLLEGILTKAFPHAKAFEEEKDIIFIQN